MKKILNRITLVAVLLVVASTINAFSLFRQLQTPRWEYKSISLFSDSADRTGTDAFKAKAIKVNDTELVAQGIDGWELVGTFLENETAYPNFGKEDYVLGLQPNVRPQRVVLLFKRQVRICGIVGFC